MASLERRIGWWENQGRRALADGLVSGAYASTLAAAREWLVSRLTQNMTWEQVLRSREIMIPTSTVVGGIVYGPYRNLVYRIGNWAVRHTNPALDLRNRLAGRMVCDVVACGTFWNVLYPYVLSAVGVESSDNTVLNAAVQLETLALGPVFGWVMDKARKKAGYLPPEEYRAQTTHESRIHINLFKPAQKT